MRRDFHLHPQVLRQPEKFQLFLDQAKKKNIGEICVTDHMPFSLSKAKDRIGVGEVEKYCKTVRELAKQYEGIIKIRCGIEIDFHPSVMQEVQEVLDDGCFDFTLASSHMHIFIRDYPRFSFNDFAAAALENSIQAAGTGLFSAISHLDMYRFAFENPERFPLKKEPYDPTFHEDLIRELFRVIKRQGMYLEINPHLAESRGNLSFLYPQEIITKWALKEKVRFSYGSDAHKPESVGAYLDEIEAHPVYGAAIKPWEKIA